MSEFLGNMRGSTNRLPEKDSPREGVVVEVPPNTPVRYMDGSSVYHPDKRCLVLRAEERIARHYAVGYILGQLQKLNASKQLDLCAVCDEKEIKPIPKRPGR